MTVERKEHADHARPSASAAVGWGCPKVYTRVEQTDPSMDTETAAVVCEEQEEERAGIERDKKEQQEMTDEMISPEMTINSLFNKKPGAREHNMNYEFEGQAEQYRNEEQHTRAGVIGVQNEQQELVDEMISPEMTTNSLFNKKP